MGVVEIKGKKYGVGFEWDTDDAEEKAKLRVNQLRSKGYFARMVKVSKNHFQVYSCDRLDEASKYPPLAIAYLHLAGGYYYMNLENKVWVLIKAYDGTIVHEGVYESLDAFENKKYDLLTSVVDDPHGKKKITVEEGRFKSGLSFSLVSVSIPKRALVFLSLSVVLLLGMFVYFTRSSESESSEGDLQAQSVQVIEASGQGQAVQESPSSVLKVGKIDFSCYDRFYVKAFTENQGSCEWQLDPDVPVDGVRLPTCKEALEDLTLLGAKVQWGQVEDYGEFLAYSFSLSGQIYAHDLRMMRDLYFTSLFIKLEGSINSITATISGVALCKKT